MTIFQSILLGIVQGITEFLPISSSGHLVIIPYLFGWQIPAEEAFIFDVLVQVATLLAVFAYFWNDLVDITSNFLSAIFKRQPFANTKALEGWFILLATVPAGLIGIKVKDLVEEAFSSPLASALFLFVTAMLLLIAERVGNRNRSLSQMNWVDALWFGVFQALAIFPGISRSGATITAGMRRNFNRPDAARFSFLMSIPIMIAAGLLASVDLLKTPNLAELLPVFIPGFITAAVAGYLSIRWLLSYLSRRPLTIFSIYCFVAGSITVAAFLLRR